MSQILPMLSVCIILASQAPAQTPFRNSRELAALTNVAFLIPESAPGAFQESGSLLRFDKRIKIANKAPLSETETFLYINTRNGSIAIRTGRAGTLGDGSFDLNNKNFRLSYFSNSGRYYTYFNREKKGKLEHFVATMNTDIIAYSSNIGFERTTVTRAAGSKTVLPQSLEATPYKAADASAPTIYLSGSPVAPRLLLKRFLGYSGIGYVKTDRGIMMIVEMSSDAGSFRATKWENVDLQLDQTLFTAVENQFNEKAVTGIENKIARLNAKTYSGACAYLKESLKIVQKRNLEQQKQALARSKQGNFINDINNQGLGALIDFQDPEPFLEEAELQADISICTWEHRRVTTEEEAQRKSRAIECANKTKLKIQKAKREMMAITRRYPNDKIKVLIEKRKLLSDYQKASRQLDCD